MTETAETIAERFARETEHHGMKILHDDGLYRHIRCMAPSPMGSAYWFELITVPGSLIFRGGGESFVFARIADMFEFFRSNPDRDTMRISPDYWSEKLTSDRDSVKAYSEDRFHQHVSDILSEVEDEWPGITAAWSEHAGEENIDYDTSHEAAAREALSDFEFGAKTVATCPCGGRIEVGADDIIPDQWRGQHPRLLGHPYKLDRTAGFRFSDTWEWDLRDFDWWYLWACHAIVWGIAQYDQAKRPIETLQVTL